MLVFLSKIERLSSSLCFWHFYNKSRPLSHYENLKDFSDKKKRTSSLYGYGYTLICHMGKNHENIHKRNAAPVCGNREKVMYAQVH